MVYNIIYIGAEVVITVIIISIPAVGSALKRIRKEKRNKPWLYGMIRNGTPCSGRGSLIMVWEHNIIVFLMEGIMADNKDHAHSCGI